MAALDVCLIHSAVQQKQSAIQYRESMFIGLDLINRQVAGTGKDGLKIFHRKAQVSNLSIGENKKLVISRGNTPLDAEKVRKAVTV